MSEIIKKFAEERKENIKKQGENSSLNTLAYKFMSETADNKYSYNFHWMGRPIIQFPQDMIAMQEIIWEVKPDLIFETGIAHGGSLIMYAGFMEMMGIENGHVLGVDIDIRDHNREEIESHPMSKRITMIEGSSIDNLVVEQVVKFASNYNRVLIILDSNHTHEHVLKELKAYSDLVTVGSYCVVFDTVVEDMPGHFYADRPWGKGDNPKTAVWEFISKNDDFIIDKEIQNKLLITVAPDGFLKRVR